MAETPPSQMRGARRDKESHTPRDASRTPMQWNTSLGAGFTSSSRPWLPLGDATAANVETQSTDHRSILWLVHDVLALRRTFRDLAVGTLEFVASPTGTLAWRRGDAALVAMNLSDTIRHIKAHGTILISVDRTRDQEHVAEWLELRPLEAVVMQSIPKTT